MRLQISLKSRQFLVEQVILAPNSLTQSHRHKRECCRQGVLEMTISSKANTKHFLKIELAFVLWHHFIWHDKRILG